MEIKVIVGLGNPGETYAHTYHNAGFLLIDMLKDSSEIDLKIPSKHIFKSDTYMNTSGLYVKEALKKTGIPPAALLIAHDDSDLPVGTYKISFGQGAAGHHGVLSVMDALHTEAFWRLRIGIRTPETEGRDRAKAEDFVLQPISEENLLHLRDALHRAIAELGEKQDKSALTSATKKLH